MHIPFESSILNRFLLSQKSELLHSFKKIKGEKKYYEASTLKLFKQKKKAPIIIQVIYLYFDFIL